MNEHTIRGILEGGGGAAGTALRALLYVPGKIYGAAMLLRRAFYARGILSSARAGIPVISIGNITAGGSGKTPLTALLANHLLARGKSPAVLLRGYRSADGAGTGSDEAILYRTLCPGARVEAGADRAASARRAVGAGADVLLMDDGFQHLRLRRDLDIVLVDATSPWGGGNCIPGGLLREPLPALARARVLIITRSDQVPPPALESIAARIGSLAPGAALFTARHNPVRLRDGGGGDIPLEHLHGRKVVLLSGIARPEAFRATLVSLGAVVADVFTGNDHRRFSKEFLEQAAARAAALDAVLVTTEKDGVKIPSPAGTAAPLWILGVEQAIDNAPALLRIVDETAG